MSLINVQESDKVINRVPEFLDEVMKWKKGIETENVVYRGHYDSTWPLKPRIARTEYIGGLETSRAENRIRAIEEFVIAQFKLRLHMFGHELLSKKAPLTPNGGRTYSDQDHTDLRCKAEWFSLVIGQHHGLPTRLLDFTKNPLAALYLALTRKDKVLPAHHAVWCISYGDSKIMDFDDLLNLAPGSQNTTIFYPPTIDQRIFAQQALFIQFRRPSLALEEQTSFSYNKPQDIIVGKETLDGKPDAKLMEALRPYGVLPTDRVTVNKIDNRHWAIIVNNEHKYTIEAYNHDYTLLQERCKIKGTCLYKIRVKCDDDTHKQLLKELNEIAVNEETMFPDLDGIAKHLDTQIKNMNWP